MHRLSFELVSSVTTKLDYTGSLVRAAFLGLAQQLCPELAVYLHDVAEIKPYALTPLSPHLRSFDVLLREGNMYHFDVTLLREEDISSMLEGLARKPNAKVRLYAYDLPASSIGVDCQKAGRGSRVVGRSTSSWIILAEIDSEMKKG